MLKNILNLEGAQILTAAEQKEINGGKLPPPGCGQGGVYTGNVNTCLCKSGGTYIPSTFSCTNGAGTGKIYENATGCCYSTVFEG
ncbi:hypothetical protein [Flavobacterium humi]|uniref:Uncharacterized protein n=1 Tax=Flavobacterium humi TaxID=2562683 RepID=A0A4Z0L907_9FLAO|nr:hypothetical protein [Flavobacterium humi]TGD57655.1 hypothetical protein E4635_10735 [Flavobacterium humi]